MQEEEEVMPLACPASSRIATHLLPSICNHRMTGRCCHPSFHCHGRSDGNTHARAVQREACEASGAPLNSLDSLARKG